MVDKEELKEELSIYKDRLEGAMEAGNLAWWEMELPSGKVKFSDRKPEMLGYSPDRFTHYTDFTDLIHPEDYDRAMKAMKDHLEGRKDRYEVEYRIKKKNGDYKWFRDIGRITGQEGECKKITGVVIDIDERKKAEMEIKRRALEWKETFNALEDMIFLVDENHEIKRVNKSLVDFLGIPKEEIHGEKCYKLIHDSDSPIDVCPLEKSLKTDENEMNEFFESSFDKYFLTKVHRMPDYGDDLEIFVHQIQDITEREEAEEREQFLHTLLRHDVRNKIQLILGYKELLEEIDLPEEAEEYILKGRRGVEEALEIIEKVSNLREAQEEEIKEISIANAIHEAIDQAEPMAEEKGIEIKEECPGESEVMAGSLLSRIFSNIIENSLQHSQGTMIKISGKETEEEIICIIEDDGVGISEGKKNEIFDKGYTTDEERGTGLGLFLVKTLVDIYEGRIKVKDSDLGGARFEVILRKP